MSSILEEHFTQLRSHLDEVESNLMGAINDNKSISALAKKVEEQKICEQPQDSSSEEKKLLKKELQ
jgi:hypothetical protein